MDMEITRLATVSWLPIPDRHVFAIRAGLLSPDCSRAESSRPLAKVPQHVPMLDWPRTLFEDGMFCN
jgi:hypothetical protein